MANGETAGDLHKEILRRCGEKDDGTSDFHAVALTYLNKAYQKVIAGSDEFNLDIGEPWPWAKSTSKITLTIPSYVGTNATNSLTATLTYNSTSGTFSQAPQVNSSNISLAGWWFQTTAASEWYLIATHVSGSTAFTLDTTFNDSSVVAGSFLAILLDFTLTAVNLNGSEPGGIQRLAAPMEVYRQQTFDNDNEYKIYGIDIREMRRIYPLSVIEMGVPTRFAITSQSNEGVFKIRVNKYSDIQTRADVEYIPVPLDLTSNPDSIPVIPREFRDVLIYIPCAWLMKDKADDRSDSYIQLGTGVLKAMVQDARKKRDHIQKQKAVIVPRLDYVNQKKRITYL